jgi:hypothetical protein
MWSKPRLFNVCKSTFQIHTPLTFKTSPWKRFGNRCNFLSVESSWVNKHKGKSPVSLSNKYEFCGLTTAPVCVWQLRLAFALLVSRDCDVLDFLLLKLSNNFKRGGIVYAMNKYRRDYLVMPNFLSVRTKFSPYYLLLLAPKPWIGVALVEIWNLLWSVAHCNILLSQL